MDGIASIKGQSYLVFGLGKSGLSVVKALAKAGANLVVSDDDTDRFHSLPKTVRGTPADAIDWSLHYDALILSPGIAHSIPTAHPVAVQAQENDIPIICDVDLLAQISPNVKTVLITGTNGKSTTTALIGHILQGHFDGVEVGGNLGKPVFDFAKKAKIHVIELSSYQLERCPNLQTDVGVWLNITPDHLDRHGDIDGYIAAKTAIFQKPRGVKTAVIGLDDSYSQDIATAIDKRDDWMVTSISGAILPKMGYGIEGGALFFAQADAEAQKCMDLGGLARLRGEHNHQNLAAAWAACAAMGVPNTIIAERVASFDGLPHRQFLTRTINGVAYINDSKATNADAAICALKPYESIHWICGGVAKAGGLEGTQAYLNHVRKAYLIGEAEEDFANWLDNHGVTYERCGTLDVATAKAHESAQEDRGLPGQNPVVLLSPACASFDQYPSFEARGNSFQKLVEGLEEAV